MDCQPAGGKSAALKFSLKGTATGVSKARKDPSTVLFRLISSAAPFTVTTEMLSKWVPDVIAEEGRAAATVLPAASEPVQLKATGVPLSSVYCKSIAVMVVVPLFSISTEGVTLPLQILNPV